MVRKVIEPGIGVRPVPTPDLSPALGGGEPDLSPSGLLCCEGSEGRGVASGAGLAVSPIERTDGGQRRYHQFDLDWITICTKLRSTGPGGCPPVKSTGGGSYCVALQTSTLGPCGRSVGRRRPKTT